ncbi:MAG TPA: hypothetical protein VKB05_12680 [Pyrinomonadaceae bacterium]|nr:hypothetical protein [Pyrinomonadaceae bacterium]
MPRVISRHFSVTMEQLLPAVVTPMMAPMSMGRTRSDVDPWYDDHSVARLRCGRT